MGLAPVEFEFTVELSLSPTFCRLRRLLLFLFFLPPGDFFPPLAGETISSGPYFS
jgi:hypothetical protein